MESNAAIFTQISALLESPPKGAATDFAAGGWGMSGFSVVLKRQLAYSLAGAAVVEAHRGQLDQAAARLHTLFRLAHWQVDEANLVGVMIGAAIEGLGALAVWEIAQAPGWEEPRLLLLQRELEQATALACLSRVMRRERAFVISLCEDSRTRARSGSSLGERLWPQAWSRQDELRYLRGMELILSAIDVGVSNRSFAAMQPGFRTLKGYQERNRGWLNQWRYPLSAIGPASWERASEGFMRQETLLQMARATIAVSLYRLRHGNAPNSLGDLIPALVADVPWDLMAGEPLHYRRTASDHYRIWSVGPNLRDDGATGDDVVWSRAERAEATSKNMTP